MTIYDIDAKCSLAIDALSTSKSLKERLLLAYNTGLVWIKPEDLTSDLRSDYQRLHERLNSSPTGFSNNEGTIQPTLRDMSDAEAEDIARLIVKLSRDVEQEAARHRYRGR